MLVALAIVTGAVAVPPPEAVVTVLTHGYSLDGEKGVWIAKAIAQAGLCESSSSARRMIQQWAVKVDGAKVSDIDLHLTARKQPYAVQVGKRGFADIEVS